MSYKLWVISSFIFLFFLPAGCKARQRADILPQGESEKPDPYDWDFGQVRQGEILQHTFILKNDSPETLKIKEVHTSCGCTLSEIKKKILSPGESTELEVKLNTKDYSGSLQQYIYVHTDNLDNPILKFIIKAEVAEGRG